MKNLKLNKFPDTHDPPNLNLEDRNNLKGIQQAIKEVVEISQRKILSITKWIHCCILPVLQININSTASQIIPYIRKGRNAINLILQSH